MRFLSGFTFSLESLQHNKTRDGNDTSHHGGTGDIVAGSSASSSRRGSAGGWSRSSGRSGLAGGLDGVARDREGRVPAARGRSKAGTSASRGDELVHRSRRRRGRGSRSRSGSRRAAVSVDNREGHSRRGLSEREGRNSCAEQKDSLVEDHLG